LFPRCRIARSRLSERGSEAAFWESPSRVHFLLRNARAPHTVWRDYLAFFAHLGRQRAYARKQIGPIARDFEHSISYIR